MIVLAIQTGQDLGCAFSTGGIWCAALQLNGTMEDKVFSRASAPLDSRAARRRWR